MNRAASTQAAEFASANNGFATVASEYPKTTSGLRPAARSLSTPEKTFTIDAVPSAMPSMSPNVTVLAPRTETRKTGSSE